MPGQATAVERLRIGLPGRRAGSAGFRLGIPLAAVRPRQPGLNVPVPTEEARVQQEAAGRVAPGQGGDSDRPGLLVIADKGFASMEFENDLAMRGAELLRPSFKRETRRRGESLLKSVRQLIESVNDTLKGQLDLEQHGGRTFEGVAVRVAQRILAMASAIWHNHKSGAPVLRSLTAFDH